MIGSQSFVNIVVLLFTGTLRLVMLSVKLTCTCFTLCSVKTWCTAAVKSVYSVYASSFVLAGMTCAVINICFEGITTIRRKAPSATYDRKLFIVFSRSLNHCKQFKERERDSTYLTYEGKELFNIYFQIN